MKESKARMNWRSKLDTDFVNNCLDTMIENFRKFGWIRGKMSNKNGICLTRNIRYLEIPSPERIDLHVYLIGKAREKGFMGTVDINDHVNGFQSIEDAIEFLEECKID